MQANQLSKIGGHYDASGFWISDPLPDCICICKLCEARDDSVLVIAKHLIEIHGKKSKKENDYLFKWIDLELK